MQSTMILCILYNYRIAINIFHDEGASSPVMWKRKRKLEAAIFYGNGSGKRKAEAEAEAVKRY